MRTLLFLLAASPLLAADTSPPSAAPPKGFTSLFDGKSLTGWKPHGGKIEKWAVDPANKTIHTGKGAGGWLMTEKEYGDFELLLEFKVPKHGNSGVALRSPMKGDPAYTGMEIQVLDDASHKGIKAYQHTGSIYGVVAASSVPTKPVGEWNAYRIVCKGSKVTIELNGKKVVETDLADHKAKHAKGHPGILRTKGHIGIQDHGGKVEFRNIFIKEL